MEPFNNRIKLTSDQRKEVERYLGGFTVGTEYGMLMIVRKLKAIEQKMEEKRYG